jgi:ABC-type transport system involved in multi-copper enzyme maturation permease subunit
VLVGPIFFRELAVTPRRRSFFLGRLLYPLTLFFFMYTAWLLVAGTGSQAIRNVGDMSQFGIVLLNLLAPIQLALLSFMAAIQATSAIAVEKDRNTLLLLLLTRLNNSELVLGRLFGSLLPSLVNLALAVPIFMAVILFGGTSPAQVFWIFVVTVAGVVLAGSWGAFVGFWREKSFQALAMALMGIVTWVALWEFLAGAGWSVAGVPAQTIGVWFSPLRAVAAASDAMVGRTYVQTMVPFCAVTGVLIVALNGAAIWRVRHWNSGRELRPTAGADSGVTIWGAEHDLGLESGPDQGFGAVDGASDAGVAASPAGRGGGERVVPSAARLPSRAVWSNPVLWREMRTWAYGRKILLIRVAYWSISLAVLLATLYLVSNKLALAADPASNIYLPTIMKLAMPFLFVSLMIVNSLGVTSITSERDAKSLDLLLVTDLTPREILFGKLLGVLFVTLDSIVFPLLFCGLMFAFGLMSGENLFFIVVGLSVLSVFAAMLGIHSGRSFPTSRPAILASLGTLFFLFLGTVTCMLLLVSFAGNVDSQLAAFLTFIVGGGIGLFWVLGAHTPSAALFTASILMPIGMFHAMTSLLLRQYMFVFLDVVVIFAFAVVAMVIPALSEFSYSTSSPRGFDDE